MFSIEIFTVRNASSFGAKSYRDARISASHTKKAVTGGGIDAPGVAKSAAGATIATAAGAAMAFVVAVAAIAATAMVVTAAAVIVTVVTATAATVMYGM